MIKLEGIEKSFGNNHVLRGVDLTVNTGEVVSIIGASGSGKSTFLRTINFLERADAGKITLDDICVDAANADKFQDWYNFTMTITAYMYQSPLETDYADDVDSDETTEEAAEKALQSATADIAAEEMTTTTIITTAADAA